MQHYICTGGCGGESDSQGVCEAQFCKNESKLLEECNCADGAHTDPGPEKSDEDVGE